MPLHPEVQQVLDRMKSADPRPRSSLTIRETREKYVQMQGLAGKPVSLSFVEDRTVPGVGQDIPVRLYASEKERQLPALVYFHGGRFISGGFETHDRVCRDLAGRSGCLIVAVDYSLAPEHRYPAAFDDAFRVTCWLEEEGESLGIDTDRIGVGGDSAGGNLAASVSILARDRGGPSLKCQILIYPMLDATCRGESHRSLPSGYGPESEDMKRGYDEYLPEGMNLEDPLVSPLYASDLAGLPPTLIQIAEYDCLRSEAEQFAEKLRMAGVRVKETCYRGAIHGFFQMAGVLQIGRRAIGEVSSFLQDALGSTSEAS